MKLYLFEIFIKCKMLVNKVFSNDFNSYDNKELQKRIYTEPFDDIIKDVLEEIYIDYDLYIDKDGLSKQPTLELKPFIYYNHNNIKQSLLIINMFFKKHHCMNSDYDCEDLKHYVEPFTKDKYISTGEFIIAMVMLGFTLYPNKDEYPSCKFNVKIDNGVFHFITKWRERINFDI